MTAPLLSVTLSPISWRNDPSTLPLPFSAGACRTTAIPLAGGGGVGDGGFAGPDANNDSMAPVALLKREPSVELAFSVCNTT
jgi:hypothetical protein